jgi:hypothetical protein
MRAVEYELKWKGKQMVFAERKRQMTDRQARATLAGYLEWLESNYPEDYEGLVTEAELGAWMVKAENLL